jgi:MYXO-CTERM domain-containing protein
MTSKSNYLHARGTGLKLSATALVLAIGLCATPQIVEAFCGFYVAGADTSLYNDATMVVLLRDGKRTVLAMQNDYQGPPEDFALVIPVPVVLQEDDVKILPKTIFDRVDKLAAPRLVEYWEEDPCEARRQRMWVEEMDGAMPAPAGGAPDPETGVKIEAQFEVGEYQIVILSAQDSTGLDTWLRREKYNIPEGAESVLRPYVEGGMKFFVAKVDVEKVQFTSKPDGGKRAMLSPLRFHYDSEEFNLPVRLGLINAQGPQDLLVHVLAAQRYQVANYPNVTIPTNLVVKDQTREHFGEFYVSLFDHTIAQTPKAVVTEYAWAAGSCDPCPEEPLNLEELVTLGANVLPKYAQSFTAEGNLAPGQEHLQWRLPNEFVLTRLHARYDRGSLGEDLVFEEAKAIAGGQGTPHDRGKLDPTVRDQPGNYSSFQARYAILHFWEGAAQCEDPLWDSWGGPPAGAASKGPAVARDLAFVARDGELTSFVSAAAHQTLGLAGTPPADPLPEPSNSSTSASSGKQAEASKPDAGKGCKCSVEESGGGPLASLLALALGLPGLLRRRRQSR